MRYALCERSVTLRLIKCLPKEGTVMHNQRGGILSKLFAIPIGVALIVGSFFIGYYIGKHEGRSGTGHQALPPLPETGAQQQLPKQEELTFYKTLTEKGNKVVSLDLKSSGKATGDAPEKKKEPERTPILNAQPQSADKKVEIAINKSGVQIVKPPDAKNSAVPGKKEVKASSQSNDTVRYSIQLASYPERSMADEEVKRMKRRGYAAFLVITEVPERGTWYRVRLGSFTKKSAADKLLAELRKKEGLSPFITTE